MIPDQSLSLVNLPADFLEPDDRVVNVREDWERGGVALNDPTQGHLVKNWRAWIEGNGIMVGAEGEAGTLILLRNGISTVSLAFDQNMRPNLAYTVGAQARLYWYDSLIGSYSDIEIVDAESPRLCLDDKRALQGSANDIILAYKRAGNLYFRAQRDRFLIEYLLQLAIEGVPVNVGMGTQNRLQIKLLRRV